MVVARHEERAMIIEREAGDGVAPCGHGWSGASRWRGARGQARTPKARTRSRRGGG
jgi:hypothetical protein